MSSTAGGRFGWIRAVNRWPSRRACGTLNRVLLTISTTMAGDRPWVSAAQASRPGPGVRAVVRRGDGVLPRGDRRALHGRAAARRRPDPARARPGDATRRTSAWRSTSTTVPYAASSLLGVALADVFSTARAGRCASRQELADSAIPLEITIPVLPCRGGADVAHRVFEPLGWEVGAEPIAARRGVPRVGRLPLRPPAPARGGPAGRRAQPAVRAAARARRVQALLAGARRGRQAAAVG